MTNSKLLLGYTWFRRTTFIGCLLSIYGCKEAPDSNQEGSANQQPKKPSLAVKLLALPSKENPVVYDIPPLLQLSMNQAKARLGRPIGEEQADYENATRMLIYKKRGLMLSVSYLVDTQQVDMVSLSIERDTTAFKYLLPLGNLSPNNTAYTIDTLHSEKPGLYRGIVVRRNPPVEYPSTH